MNRMDLEKRGKHMKMMKKLAVTLLAIMLVCPCFANVAFAAEGVAFFDDLETKVGDEFTVKGTVVAKNDVIGDVTIEIEYDTEYVQFISGDSGVKNSTGKITYTGSGDGSSDRITFNMTFQALAEGDTQMDQTLAEVTTNSGATVNCTMGYSAISIGEGDPSKIKDLSSDDEAESDNSENSDAQTENKKNPLIIGSDEYKISKDFSEAEIPSGFSAAEVTYNGKTYSGVTQATAGVNAVFATNQDGYGKFFIINSTEDDLYPLEEFVISEEYSIFILHGTEDVKMPKEYVQANIAINEVDYPVWIEPEREGFYIFYAVNNMGEKSLYLYDSVERTYQRMETPKTAESEENEVSTFEKIIAYAESNVVWIIVGAGCAIIVLLILSIVLGVKLKHRNLELDDLYDEYGIDMEDKETPAAPVKNIKEEKDYLDASELEDDYYDDEYDNDSSYEYEDNGYEYADDEYEYEYEDDEYEYEDDEYEYEDDVEYEYEDESADYYAEDELADLRRDYAVSSKSASTKSNYDSYYDDDDFEDDDYCETRERELLRKDDTFEMNFIDLE